jgi:hypothetical protein
MHVIYSSVLRAWKALSLASNEERTYSQESIPLFTAGSLPT